MATLFIADLHLSNEEPAITAGFLHFLQHQAVHAEALYILGDLFEAWIGDDDPNPLHAQVAGALKALSASGTPCYFIHGNRDFLLGKRYARAAGMKLLPEVRVLELHGHRLVILHGDTLCTDDHNYQRFRRRVHHRWLQQLFLALPLRLRLAIARRMRADSQRANTGKPAAVMDVNLSAVRQMITSCRAQWMIHGHTHRPAVHSVVTRTGESQRVVLGAWHQQGSLIRVDARGVELVEFPFGALP